MNEPKSSLRPVRIDIVSDVVCPWCIIGYKRLEQALEALSGEVAAEIHWHPFELNPHMQQGGENLREHIAAKYGSTPEDSARARAKLSALGEQLGFEFDYFDEMKMFNTFKAHQLLHYAREQGKESELKLRLFAAFFRERKQIDQLEVLVEEAAQVGLDADEARALLQDERYAKVVRSEEHGWMARGVRAVPTFVFNQRYGVSGAQEASVLQKLILEALEPEARNASTPRV